MTDTQKLLKDLATAKALFQARAIMAAMGEKPEKAVETPERRAALEEPADRLAAR